MHSNTEYIKTGSRERWTTSFLCILSQSRINSVFLCIFQQLRNDPIIYHKKITEEVLLLLTKEGCNKMLRLVRTFILRRNQT